jgi:integrase
MLVRTRARIPRQRLPQFPKSDIETLLIQISNINLNPTENKTDTLVNFRDKAFLISLADTGLRVHEACNLRRGDIDWFEKKAIVIGKGNREGIVRFSDRSITAIKDYLKIRSTMDGSTGVPLSSLPIFARHDKGAGKKIKPITTTTGRKIVASRVEQYLGKDAVGTITPHSFRHYYVTRVLQYSGNLKLAQSLARHTNIAITQRYAHINDDELDKGYNEIFDK